MRLALIAVLASLQHNVAYYRLKYGQLNKQYSSNIAVPYVDDHQKLNVSCLV